MSPRRAMGAAQAAGAVLLLAASAATAAADTHDVSPGFRSAEPAAVHADSIRFALRVTDNNQMGITITNYGFIGNNFVSRSPSLEYPLGLAFEHMVRGGLWVGAQAIDENGSFVSVMTGAVDGGQGSSAANATEFTPAGLDIHVRSTLPNNKFFNTSAVSEQDYISEFSDYPPKQADNTNERSRPMGLLVRQENYAWSFSDFQHFVIFHYVIKNNGPPLRNVWVGMYNEFASGAKNLYSVWPPSSSGSALGSWFSKKWIQYDDSLRLFREHYCNTRPAPESCNLPLVPYWIGLKLLGARPGNLADTSDKKVTLASWTYAPGSALRDEDIERYAIMNSGQIQDLSGDDFQPTSGDPVNMLAVGPFRQIDPGDSVEVDFAIVGGAEIPDIQEHARFAQRAYDRDYIVPVPPPSPRFAIVARDNEADLYWDNSPESAMDPTSPNPLDFEGYRVYLGDDRLDLKRVAQFDRATPPNDTTGFNTGFGLVKLDPPVDIDGVTYHYRYSIGSLRNGFKYFAAVTAYDLGNVEIESLESGIAQNKRMFVPGPAAGERPGTSVTVFPNPYRVEARWDQGTLVRDHYLWFANLPERGKLKIFTLSGDLVFEEDFDANYKGQGTRGLYDPNRELDVPAPTLSGRMFAWDLITREGQAAATGLYLYSVEDAGTGKKTVGKFLVIKSDREAFN